MNLEVHSQHFCVDGVSLHVSTAGQGPPLLLLHGWTNDWRIWRPLAAQLADRYQLIMVDMPGFGVSDRLPSYELATMAQLLQGLLRQFGLSKAPVAGLSLGSFVAAYLAENHQDSFGPVILVGPILAGPKKRWIKRILRLCRRAPWLGWLLTRTIKSPVSGYIMERFVNSRAYDPTVSRRFSQLGRGEFCPRAYLEFGLACFRIDVERALLASQQRLLLVYGEHDKHARPGRLYQLAAARRGIVVAEIAGGSHNSPFEAPAATAAVFAAFLAAKSIGNGEPVGDDLSQTTALRQLGQRLIDVIE